MAGILSDASLTGPARVLAARLVEQGWRLAVAESCTGGGLGYLLTSLPGSSQWFERGFVTYSNLSKREMLGVPVTILEQHGAVSEACARVMAEGALTHSAADIAVAITGIAGPEGGTAARPVGTVWLAYARRGGDAIAEMRHFQGGRDAVRQAAIAAAVEGLIARLPDVAV